MRWKRASQLEQTAKQESTKGSDSSWAEPVVIKDQKQLDRDTWTTAEPSRAELSTVFSQPHCKEKKPPWKKG